MAQGPLTLAKTLTRNSQAEREKVICAPGFVSWRSACQRLTARRIAKDVRRSLDQPQMSHGWYYRGTVSVIQNYTSQNGV